MFISTVKDSTNSSSFFFCFSLPRNYLDIRIFKNRHERQRSGKFRADGSGGRPSLAPRESSGVQRQPQHGDFNGPWSRRSFGKYSDCIACSEWYVFIASAWHMFGGYEAILVSFFPCRPLLPLLVLRANRHGAFMGEERGMHKYMNVNLCTIFHNRLWLLWKYARNINTTAADVIGLRGGEMKFQHNKLDLAAILL